MTTIEPHNAVIEKIFAPSREGFDRLIGDLQSEGALALTHSELENQLWSEGMALLRQLFQDHLDLRSVREVRHASLCGQDGVSRTHRRPSSRNLETVFGSVTVSRLEYRAPGHDSLHPLDAALNLSDNLFSHGVSRRIAESAAQGAYETAIETLAATSGASVAKRQAETLAIKAAVDFDAFYAQRAAPPTGRESILVLTVDGKGIVMRQEDLREGTRKSAQKGSRKLKHRLAKGEKPNRKRMSTVAGVYTIGKFIRTPADIVDDLRREKKAVNRPRPHHKRVWASVVKSPEEVIREAFAEAHSRDPHRQKTWVAVVDGNATQLEILQRLAKEFDVQLTIVLDIIHVIEYLWKAAHAFLPDGTPDAEDWVTQRLEKVLSGSASHVAAGMRRSATCQGFSPERRAPIDKCADYLLNHVAFLHYDEYLASGIPIASGVIEGACRHLIKDRMDITGARWRLNGAEAVLRLRALCSSGDFDAYWRFHEVQEAKRNHAAIFALPITPQTPQPPALEASAS